MIRRQGFWKSFYSKLLFKIKQSLFSILFFLLPLLFCFVDRSCLRRLQGGSVCFCLMGVQLVVAMWWGNWVNWLVTCLP